jgi:archaeosortase C (PEF-CTERM variant)
MRFDSQRFRFLAGLILLLAGLEIAITLTYMARWIGLVMMIFGLLILVITARKTPEDKKEQETKREGETEEIPTKEKRTLAQFLISTLTLNGRLNSLLPVFGAAIIIFVYAFNFMYREGFEIGVNDTLTILLGATLMLYSYVPEKFAKERDFVFLFFFFMVLVLVLPLFLYELLAGPIPENPRSPYIYWLLARPTADMLNFVGISSVAKTAQAGVIIDYKSMQSGAWDSVGIGISCTGLYSVSIFISGFIAFILLEYQRFDLKVASLLTLGVFTSWLANIFRMTIIVVVGSYYGREALRWTHANVGIFIFMIWVGIFWGLMFKLLFPGGRDETEGSGDDKAEGEVSEGSLLEEPKEPQVPKDEDLSEKKVHLGEDEVKTDAA